MNDYSILLEPNHANRAVSDIVMRESRLKLCKDEARTKPAKESFLRDAAKLWNLAPNCIKPTHKT